MSSDLTPTKPSTSPLIVSNKLYDFLKFVAQVFLPALGALYFGLSQIWGLPNGEEVVGTITLVDVFLGALLQISTRQYNNSDVKYDGALNIDTADPTKDVYTFEVAAPLEELRDKQALTIRVQKPTG